ncbi:MAG TPA: sensor histidine kinase, partial [Lachnospiraceae bacterium]|nr:sensor histidine kinase [Lachnospiraceae bacterium]
MDKKYLSFRIRILAVIAAVLYLLSAAVYGYGIIRKGLSVWPLLAELILFAGLLSAAWFWVIKPYRYNEKNMQLFLDGYTTANMDELRMVELT